MQDIQIEPVLTVEAVPEELQADAKGVFLRDVTKKYGSFAAVQNITLDIPAGSYTCLLGPSGCGKTTTMRMIAGHEDISAGDIYIGETRINDIPATQRNTAMMFQNYALFPHKTVWDNVDFGLKMRGMTKADRHYRVGEMLEVVGLSSFSDRKPAQLSGGQQQRVALARALLRSSLTTLWSGVSGARPRLRYKRCCPRPILC